MENDSRGTLEEIPLALLLPPLDAARSTFDEVQLEELIGSIALLGVLQNLVVEREGTMYRIHAGHRRFIAATALGLVSVPCRVFAAGQVPGEAVKEAENAFREELNPAEQALHFDKLLRTRCEGDTDRLAEMVKRDRNFVESRILLLRGDSLVFEALRNKQVTLAVAGELNRVKNELYRMSFLDAAIRGGASARVVRQWRIDHERLGEGVNIDALPESSAEVIRVSTDTGALRCWFCKDDKHPYMMEMFYLHNFCREALENMMSRGADTMFAKQ